ncbi:MAG: hypothetical protein KDC53_03235 [Saprospiraceae bacterium]|nr:hypothetical protein [Saprospiraceae bacterium]
MVVQIRIWTAVVISLFVWPLVGQKLPCGNDNGELKIQWRDFVFENPVTSAGTKRSALPIYEVPVVVHIFHAGDALGTQYNPSDAEIQAIIEEASLRFRHQHPGAANYTNPYYGVDTEISLCLAKVDPLGNQTNGIVRYNDPALATGNGLDLSSMFAPYMWARDYYCNLIVMRDMQDACGWYLGGLDATLYDSGCFWSGLVAHEVGHYFSLLHTFQGSSCANNDCDVDGDQICDTPAKSAYGFNDATACDMPNNQCTTDEDDPSSNNPYRAVALGGMGEQPDMLSNYLDYTGGCWDSFTEGQKARMRAFIENFRNRLISSPAICSGDPDLVLSSQCFDISLDINKKAIATQILLDHDKLPAAISTPIEIAIYVVGYIPFSTSTFAITGENNFSLGTTNYNNNGNNCGASPDLVVYIDPAQYNNWIVDGVIELTFQPNNTFYPDGCGRTEICLQFKVVTQDCTGNYSGAQSLTGPIMMNGVYISNNSIESRQVIQGMTNNVFYQSAESIQLLPEFSINAGNIFSAAIGGCNE